jgi:hypothetical protein
VVLKFEQLRRLPGQQFVGEALEGLAKHDPAACLRVAGAQVQVGQPALPPAMAPFDGEHYQVERVPGLDLDPAGATPSGGVRGGERLDDYALVPSPDGVAEKRRRLVG